MNRRQFLYGTLGAAVTTPFLPDVMAQGPLPPAAVVPVPVPVTRRLVLDANSRHLQWLREGLGQRFVRGLVLHTGPRMYELSDSITAAPISALWG